MSEPLRIANREARGLFLETHGLALPRRGPCDEAALETIIRDLGFVQLDTINTVARAHDMILFSRKQNFNRDCLAKLHEGGALFEHWTHDASVIPMEFYPYWQTRFANAKAALKKPGWKSRIGPNPKKTLDMVRGRIEAEGPLMSRDFQREDGKKKSSGTWWGWSPTKTALEFLWRTGELAVVKRDGFQKVYDLAERVIPDGVRDTKLSKTEIIDFKCRSALARLGFATPTEIARFWDTLSIAEATAWTKAHLGKDLQEVVIKGAKGEPDKKALAFLDLEDRLAAAPAPSKSLRFLSPFDPMIRDRKRLKQLFGFDYTIEIFVPEKKRVYGYYVLPILEGDRLVGRADLKAERKDGFLDMKGLWLEPGVKLTSAREAALHRELDRLAKFCGVESFDAECPLGVSQS